MCDQVYGFNNAAVWDMKGAVHVSVKLVSGKLGVIM